METLHNKAIKNGETNKKTQSLISPHRTRRTYSSEECWETFTKTPPKAKLHHDDSQIQFAAIDSSPIGTYDLDSQRLTERQKLVKERQSREGAVFFPQIHSSPIRKNDRTTVTLPRLSLSQAESLVVNHVYEDEFSPVFPSSRMLTKENLGSSPTPSAGRTPSEQTGVDVPSSAPGTLSFFNTPSFMKDSSQEDVILGSPIQPGALEGSKSHANEPRSSRQPGLETSEDVQSKALPEGVTLGSRLRDCSVANDISKGLEPAVSNANIDNPSSAIFSDVDIFVDAHSEVNTDIVMSNQKAASIEVSDVNIGAQHGTTREQSSDTDRNSPVDGNKESIANGEKATPEEDGDTSQITDSMIQFLDRPSDDDDSKVEQQLTLELEHASSQNDSFATKAPPLSMSTRKRKADSPKEQNPRKKSRRRQSSSNFQIVIDAHEHSSVEDDTVLVDVRQATRTIDTRSAAVRKAGRPCPNEVSIADVPRTSRSTKATRGRGGSHASNRPAQSSSRPTQGILSVSEGVEESLNQADANKTSAGAVGSSRRRSSRLAQSSSFDTANEVTDGAESTGSGKVTVEDQVGIEEPMINAVKEEAVEDDDAGSSSFPTDISSTAFEADDVSLPAETETTATAGEILAGFHAQLKKLKRAQLGAEEERTIVGVAFEIVREAHEAGRRSHRRSVSE